MISRSIELGIRPDEIALYFGSDGGIEAGDLGQFLQRVAKIAREEGAELRVTATREGSLAVIFNTIKKRSGTARAARREFEKSPIQTTGVAVGIVAAVAAAITNVMSPEAGATPLAKSGARVFENQQMETIEIVTVDETVILMDRERAYEVRRQEKWQRRSPEGTVAPDVRALIADARAGTLTGQVIEVEGEPHFRPDGHRYLVPIDMHRSEGAWQLRPGLRFGIAGELVTVRGLPDVIIIHEAERF